MLYCGESRHTTDHRCPGTQPTAAGVESKGKALAIIPHPLTGPGQSPVSRSAGDFSGQIADAQRLNSTRDLHFRAQPSRIRLCWERRPRAHDKSRPGGKGDRLGDLTRRDGEVIVETIFGSVIGALQSGDKIEIRGFGSFRIRQRNPRIGRNPKTGERVEFPPRRCPTSSPPRNCATWSIPARQPAPPDATRSRRSLRPDADHAHHAPGAAPRARCEKNSSRSQLVQPPTM